MRFSLDPEASLLYFEGHTPLHSFQGKAKGLRGEVQGDSLEGILGEVAFPVDSLSTGLGKRDRDMRGRHLESAKHPEIRFGLRGVALTDSGGYLARGILAIHGVSRPVSIPLNVSPSPDTSALFVRGRFPLLLSDFGLSRPRFLFNVMRDRVDIGFSLRWVRQP